jgi:hypothetical protein
MFEEAMRCKKPTVLATVQGQSPDLRSAAAQLGVSVADLDEEFGVQLLDPERGLYAVRVCGESLPPGSADQGTYRGPFSDPKIAPFGPSRKRPKE